MQIKKFFQNNKNYKLLKQTEHGLEKESLRVNAKGELSKKRHPSALGAPIANSFITTDFAEAQLELIAPKAKSEQKALNCLNDIHFFVNNNLSGELMWPASMPCILPAEKEIKIAEYGSSKEAEKRELYRKGLSYRYGRKMQTISGIHYNFSFNLKFWEKLHAGIHSSAKLQDFINTSYLAIARNFLRYNWLCTYLFGASPLAHESFYPDSGQIKKYPYATSLRQSSLGYDSRAQVPFTPLFNDLDEYVAKLVKAKSTPYKAYQKFPEQINSNVIQVENEFYSSIRPKQVPRENESSSEALKARGIKYLEIRSLDLCPFSPSGINLEQLRFMNVFLIFCLFESSPKLTLKERKEISSLKEKIALKGREQAVLPKREASVILNRMLQIAHLLDKNYLKPRYVKVVEKEIKKIKNPALTPSGRLAEKSAEKGFIEFCLERAKENMKKAQKCKLRFVCLSEIKKEIKRSKLEKRRLEKSSS